jgi:hypothetical protein
MPGDGGGAAAMSPTANEAMAGTVKTAGKLHLLDLTAVRTRMADRWERMSESIARFFESAIRRHLGPGDTFTRQGELSYILLFRELSPDEARLKCCTICEELGERLFGDEVEGASLRALVAALTPGLAATDAPAVDALLERKGKETIIRIRPSREEADEGAHMPAAAPAQEPPARPPPAFRWRPLWDAAKSVVITYLCHPQEAGEAGREPDAESRQAALDRAILAECAAGTCRLHARGFRLLHGVPVALDTISHSRLWAPYSRALQQVPPDVSRDFAFFVTGIDSGVPNIRLTQELPKLSRLSRNIFCLLTDRGYVAARFLRTGTHAVGIALSPADAEAVSAGRISELAQQAGGAGIAAFVLGLPSTSLMLHALAAGIRYLEGPVVRPAIGEPRFAFAQSLEDIYTGESQAARHA